MSEPTLDDIRRRRIEGCSAPADVDYLLSMVDRQREALEDLYDWQNGPPLLKPSWLKGWNDAMEKAADLLGRKHERMDG